VTTPRYQAQTTGFYKSYDVETKSDFSETSDIVLTYDSSYVVTCTYYDQLLASPTIELFKINSLGSMVWRQTFLCPNTPFNANIIQTPDSGFMVTASYNYPLDTTQKIILIKTDKFGNKQWLKLLGDNFLIQTNYDAQIEGDNIFLLSYGHIKLPGNLYQPAYFVAKTDLLGNILWYKYYNWAGTPYPKTFVVTQNKELFISGEINNAGYSQLAMSKIDSTGNLVWSKIYSPYGDIDALNMILDSAGNLILTGHKWISNNDWDIFLMKIDSLGNYKWGQTYGGTKPDEGWAVFQSQSGYVICAEPESFVTSRASLIKTDSVGNIQWMKIYGDTTGSFPNGALQLNNGFVIFGINGKYSSISPVYLLKTDLNGISTCKWFPVSLPATSFTLTPIDTGSTGFVQGVMTYSLTEIIRPINDYDFCTTTSIEDYNYLINNPKIYPNPNSGSFKINIFNESVNGELIILDSLGQRVYQQNIRQGVNDINTTGLPKGLYNYSILYSRQVTGSGRLVIE
jgi:hypothetical protein